MRLITIAIHTFPHASALKQVLEREGIAVTLQNVNLEAPEASPGVRVRISEHDLPLALRIIENPDIFPPEPAGPAVSAKGPVVLLPIDFSHHSIGAVASAFSLAAAHKARVVLLHAVAAPSLLSSRPLSKSLTFSAPGDASQADADAMSRAQGRLRELAEAIRRQIKSGEIEAAPFDTLCREGLPEEVVNEVAKERRPLAIVMGTRGADRKKREVVGSVTAEVLDTCRRPVLTVPEDTALPSLTALEHALFFANPDQLDIAALDQMARLLPKGRPARVTLVTLPSRKSAKGTADDMDNLLAYCISQWPDIEFRAKALDPERAVIEMMRLDRGRVFDLMVVPNRHRNMIARFFNPTLAHRILFHSDVPMMVVPV